MVKSPGESNSIVDCVVEDGGVLSSRKGVNVPGTMVDLPAIGPNDEAALAHALKAGADYIAVSYVRTAKHLEPAQKAVRDAGLHVPLIAKIEHPVALEHLDEILDSADAVMVARDLGVEILRRRARGTTENHRWSPNSWENCHCRHSNARVYDSAATANTCRSERCLWCDSARCNCSHALR